jgi:hypothetical protein|tara:strand:+ start:88 stop:321 length:234 start_codon:yes stop_codon:yes gene_type:complete
MDMVTLKALDKMPLDDARSAAVKLINPKTKILVLNRLKYDISVARNAGEVSRIMWQVYMSGTGYGTLNSSWKKHYGN